jgi:flagellar protein FlaG
MPVQNIGDSTLNWSIASTRSSSSTTDTANTSVADTSSAVNDAAISNTLDTTTSSSTTVGDSQQLTEAEKKKQMDDTQQAAQALQDFVLPLNNELTFSVDQDTGTTVVKVIDKSNGDVIKQIPSEEAIALAKALDKLRGLFVQQKA